MVSNEAKSIDDLPGKKKVAKNRCLTVEQCMARAKRLAVKGVEVSA